MTVIGVGRDITWFLVSSPAVMRKTPFLTLSRSGTAIAQGERGV